MTKVAALALAAFLAVSGYSLATETVPPVDTRDAAIANCWGGGWRGHGGHHGRGRGRGGCYYYDGR